MLVIYESLATTQHETPNVYRRVFRAYNFTVAQSSRKSSAVAEMGDHVATIDTGRKEGAAVSLSVGELGPHLTQRRLGRGLPPYQVAS